MVVNDDACVLKVRGTLKTIASRLAPAKYVEIVFFY